MSASTTRMTEDRVDLYWIPLGAGGRCVQLNGRIFEAVVARREQRPRCDLYHAALVVRHGGRSHAIEMAPAWTAPDHPRHVACTGAVGLSSLGRSRWFRYEVRCTPDGVIPDLGEAVDSPRCLSHDPEVAARVLGCLRDFPTATWGRDEQRTGDMWNSNSLVAWALTRSGLDAAEILPPRGGRAPGWAAGLVVAARAPAGGTRRLT